MERRFCVIDAEGARDKLDGVAFWSDERHDYLTSPDAIRMMLTGYAVDGFTFLAHNAQYDLPVIFWTLDIPMRAVYYDTHFNRGQWRYDPKRPLCELWDTLNLSGNLSVADLGKAIGLEKYPTPQILRGIDPNKYEWICDEHQRGECIPCYALRDAEIVYRYMASLTSVVEGWGVKPQARIAAIAQSVWRALDRPSPVRLRDGRIRYLARHAYYGGRVECFRLGHIAPLYVADFQSMYPSVMLEGRFPDPATMVYVEAIRPDDLPLHLEGVCEAVVSVPATAVPPLPHSHKGSRVFATGLQRGYWTFCELRYALTTGCQIHRIYRAGWGVESLSPFTTLISVLWELRQEYKRKGDPRAQTVKVLMNSCYGRLGLRGDLTQETIEPWDDSLTMEDYAKRALKRNHSRKPPRFGQSRPELGVHPEIIDGKPYVRYGNPVPFEHTWTNVLWAAQITALARIKLHRALVVQGGNLVYCDTDSVFSTAPILGLGDGLGSLTDQTNYARGWIVGPKLYSLEDHQGETTVKAKGVPKVQALRFLQGEDVWFESPVSPRAQRHGGHKAGEWIQIHRERQLVPYRRQPTNPDALQSEWGWSDTVPLVIGPGG